MPQFCSGCVMEGLFTVIIYLTVTCVINSICLYIYIMWTQIRDVVFVHAGDLYLNILTVVFMTEWFCLCKQCLI